METMTTLAMAYELSKLLDNYIKNVKEQVKDNTLKLENNSFGSYSIKDKTRYDYSKEDKIKIDKWATTQLMIKRPTHYKEMDITTTEKTKNKAKQLFNELVENTNDKTIQKVASKIIIHNSK